MSWKFPQFNRAAKLVWLKSFNLALFHMPLLHIIKTNETQTSAEPETGGNSNEKSDSAENCNDRPYGRFILCSVYFSSN